MRKSKGVAASSLLVEITYIILRIQYLVRCKISANQSIAFVLTDYAHWTRAYEL